MALHGQSIYLRILTPEDASEEYLSWMLDDEVTKYLDSRDSRHTLESIRAYIQAMSESPNDVLLGIFLHTSHRHIGNIKIGNINRRNNYGDVGLLIGAKDSWGKGYGADAISLATQYGLGELRLNKLIAGMHAENIGSYKAFMKSGYREVGRFERHVILDGQYVDCFIVEKCHD